MSVAGLPGLPAIALFCVSRVMVPPPPIVRVSAAGVLKTLIYELSGRLMLPSLLRVAEPLPSNSKYEVPIGVKELPEASVRLAILAPPLSVTAEPGALMKTLSVKPLSPGLVPGPEHVSQETHESSGPNQLSVPPVQ